MNICMMTNTYLPHVGGVARSVSTFAEEYKKLGHQVLVIATQNNCANFASSYCFIECFGYFHSPLCICVQYSSLRAHH